MQINVTRELAALVRLTIAELRARYAEVFGEPTTTGNRTWLAWRIQVLAEGDLSQRARSRAAELARDADIRRIPPKGSTAIAGPVHTGTVTKEASDARLPPPGSVITRAYKGATIHVKVLTTGFGYDARTFPSLSAVAEAVTGTHGNGFHFFKLNKAGAA
ncbi:Putative bacteriophage related protein OS=Isosphaera pallida (strain ATCC 43644 / DSM 9630 / IS1B) GN=Isop_2454 PE=4 SV=1: DUF2924 [Gemmata massiliana]|uniref:DUF2924 domain-containing protein n=1 Tax=Gemmata massiliana TaxID=1210884 RepID=A0A6P2CV39_9BACT|nr:DUF2924 domain-containing protein [Gemmata massiliana]VTR92447.1 Putative bacteriophage related protein OS=Isosphaera pallida (strain ATCC 43644 / DSM 9630 / IS1B) GN=Isop_2454 PE=4 SV=1: DUF2924 [Gemmata massiliana]VTR92459.1 Putative bacteriophage related protein OS=Isosphaera pallida (strain ATCC 43644 / DSM 9630 / IS1B) GN=Isop_2454 PE=4 SV=1: DUF2924 [Gemmata massiliana]